MLNRTNLIQHLCDYHQKYRGSRPDFTTFKLRGEFFLFGLMIWALLIIEIEPAILQSS